MTSKIIKGKKQLRVYDIPVDIYDRELSLYIGKTMDDAAYGAESEFPGLELGEFSNTGEVACAIRMVAEEGNSANVILIGIKEVGNIDLLGICAHECLHSSWHILDQVGVELTVENHEAQAYLMEFLFKNCKNAVKHYIKTYKLKTKL